MYEAENNLQLLLHLVELKWSEPKETAKKVKAAIILGVFPNYFIPLNIQKPLISLVAISEKKSSSKMGIAFAGPFWNNAEQYLWYTYSSYT